MSMTKTAPPSAAATPHGASTTAAHIDAVDGLRALAVLGVLGFHLDALPGGFLGVDLFFVISGYVITRTILSQREARTFHLRGFWAGRVKRLVPAVLLVVLAVEAWLFFAAPAGLERVTDGQALSSLAYVTNWFDIVGDFGYADASRDASPLNHLWSLAIEEQFYLLWPAAILLLRRRAVIASVTTAGVAIGMVYAIAAGPLMTFDRLYQGTDVRMVALLGGAMLAAFGIGDPTSLLSLASHVSGSGQHHGPRSPRRRRWPGSGSRCRSARTSSPDRSLLRCSSKSCSSRPSSPVVTAVLRDGSAGSRCSSSDAAATRCDPWHWPVIVIVSETHTGWTGWDLAAARIVGIVVLTLASYALVENPLRRRARTGAGLWGGLAAAVAAVVALAVLPAGALTSAAPTGRTSPSSGTTSQKLPAIEPGMKVLVVGDSWAANLAQGMASPDFGEATPSISGEAAAASRMSRRT